MSNEVKAAEVPMVTDGVIQARGVWHRPNVTGTETNLQGVCDVLDTLQKTGINLVFLETFFHGMTIYRSDLIPYYTGFDAFDYSPYPDYLSAFVAEAQKRDIEVHAWVEDFYVGVNENYFTKNLRHWMMLTKAGSIRQSEGEDWGGYLFLDPANPEVRQYLIRFYDEILTKFPQIAGLNLDYIRYPVSSQADDTGFTDVAMDGFAAENGIVFPDNATREDKVKMVSAQYGKWVTYRASQVTTFVGEVFQMVKSQHPGVLLSTAVFPEQGKSFGDKKQDFNTWLKNGYLDIITPMAYYDDIATLKGALKAMLPGLEDCYCYAGISPTYHSLSNDQVLAQMQTAVQTGADGFVFFGSQSILNNQKYIDLLEATIPTKTLLPHGQAKVLFVATAEKVQKVLSDAGEPQENVQQLLQQLDDIAQTIEDNDVEKLEQAEKQMRLLVKYNLSSYLSEQGAGYVKQDLDLLYRWIGVKATRLSTKTDRPNVDEEQPADPEEPEPDKGPEEPQPSAPTQTPTQDSAQNQQENVRPTKAIGLGAAIAAIAAIGVACFQVIRKGRKKK